MAAKLNPSLRNTINTNKNCKQTCKTFTKAIRFVDNGQIHVLSIKWTNDFSAVIKRIFLLQRTSQQYVIRTYAIQKSLQWKNMHDFLQL